VLPPQDDGGTAGDAGAGEAADAGGIVAETTPDAGLADAGTDAGTDGGVPPDAGAADAGAPLADAGTDGGTAPDAGAAVAKRPEPVRDFDYWIAQGDRQRERERADPAMSAYDKAAELAPDRAEPYAGRGLVHLDLGDYSLAEAEFLRALKLNPRYAVALMGLAETYRSQGKKAEAIRYYERYLEVLPNGPEAAVARSALERLRE
jgi:tetratricopeptide (TPR) repeat protein